MSAMKPTTRLSRMAPGYLRCLRCVPQIAPSAQSRLLSSSLATRSPPPTLPKRPIDAITLHRIEEERRSYYKRRSYYSAAGFVAGMIAIWVIATSIDLPDKNKPTKLDSRPDDPLVTLGKERKVVIQKLGEDPSENDDVVQTGTSTVPTFPRLLEFSDGAGDKEVQGVIKEGLVEYQLIGLGIRKVSFLGVEVYVVGLYIATDDIASLQEALIRKIDPVATTLVQNEKTKLRDLLLDPEKGEQIWSEVIKNTGVRSIVRIVPTKDTDFGHLRDAWVRSITARAKHSPEEFSDAEFGASVNKLKSVLSKGNIPKRKELLLARAENGKMAVWYDGKTGPQRLGDVEDERISRAIWLCYLGGKNVASEPARRSIVDGVMEFVERPVGTVATQVHV